MKNFNNLGFAPLVVIIIVVAALAMGGYFYWQKADLELTESPTQTPSESTGVEVYNSLKDLANWTTANSTANVTIRECTDGKKHDPALSIFQMSYIAPQDSQGAYITSEVTTRIPKIKQLLESSGWKKCSGPDEPGFYYQNTYIKNGVLLGLNWGIRDAVIGGTYITIQVETSSRVNTSDETKIWKTYTSLEYDFEVKIPSDTTVTVHPHETSPTVNFTYGSGKFDVRLRRGDMVTLDKYFYLDFTQSGKSTLAGQEAVIFKAPKGYCDGPGCSDPFITYSTKQGNSFYNVVFYGDTELNTTEQTILASFKFIK